MSSPAGAPPDRGAFAERLYVPFGWWALAFGFAASMFVAVGFYLGLGPAVITLVVIMVAIGAVFVGYGRTELLITDDALWAGRAHLDWRYVGRVRALDAERARLRRGRDADVRAWLLLRPYTAGAVEIEVDDADDPAPYWLVSTRHPRRFADAVAARAAGPHAGQPDGRGIEDRGIEDRGIEDRGIEDRVIEDRVSDDRVAGDDTVRR